MQKPKMWLNRFFHTLEFQKSSASLEPFLTRIDNGIKKNYRK